MPAFIIAAGITLGSQLWSNNKRKKAAEEAERLLRDQVNARNDLIQGYNNDLDELMQNFEDGTLPVNKVIPEKGKVGGSAYDALETAKKDQAVENMIEVGEDKPFSTRLTRTILEILTKLKMMLFPGLLRQNKTLGQWRQR